MAKGIPWHEIKAEFITTDATYPQLAERYNVHLSSVKKKSVKECWKEQKKAHVQMVEDFTDVNLTEAAKDKAQINLDHLKVWSVFLQKTSQLLEKPLSCDNLSKLSSVMERTQRGERLAAGLEYGVSVDTEGLDNLIKAITASADEPDKPEKEEPEDDLG